jgi:hypothetical protein
MVRNVNEDDVLHPIRILCQRVNDQLLVPSPPSPHVCVRLNDRFYVIDNIAPLSCLVVKGHRVRRQRPEDRLDVHLGSARDTDT